MGQSSSPTASERLSLRNGGAVERCKSLAIGASLTDSR
jgi:hypothetical protein